MSRPVELLLGLTIILSACLWVFIASPAFSQEQLETGPAEQQQEPSPTFASPVIIDGEELFMVRGSSALPANERAEMVQNRILAVAKGLKDANVNMDIRDGVLGRSIYANGRLVTVTTDADAEFDQMDVEVLVALHSEAIEAAILAYHKARTDDARAYGVVEALGWSAVFIVASFLILQLRKRVTDRMANWMARRATMKPTAANKLVQGPAIEALIKHGLRMLFLLAFIILLYYYLSFVLLAFAETRPFAQLLITYVTDPVLDLVIGFVSYLPNLLAIAVIATFTNFVIKGFKLFFENVELGTISLKNFQKSWIWPTFNIIRVLLILVAIVVSFPYIPGSDSAAFQGLTILVGVMVSLGSNSVIANALAGIFVIYRRSTNIGDRIKVGPHTGNVVEIKLMETYLKSIKNELVSIPNSQLLNSEVINYTSKIDRRGLLVHTTVGIGYEEPQEKIEAMLIEAAHRTDGLKDTPSPFVLFTALADFAINYQINAYTTRGMDLPKIHSDLHRNIVAVFNENQVQIMTPSYMADPETPKIAETSWDGVLASRIKTD